MISRKERRKLQAEIKAAREQLERVEARDEQVNEIHRKLRVELEGNHMGERLREHFRESRRRPGHGMV